MNPDYLSVRSSRITSLSTGTFREFVSLLTALNCSIVGRLPWVCLLVVFIAAPLGIVYSRRGILGSVATAIALFFSLVFFSSLFVALGKGNRISPVLATWGPLTAYFLVGLGLFMVSVDQPGSPKVKLPGRADAGERVGNQVESHCCARTGRRFQEGEYFYTLLFREEGFRREDISEEAWSARNENIEPFSFGAQNMKARHRLSSLLEAMQKTCCDISWRRGTLIREMHASSWR